MEMLITLQVNIKRAATGIAVALRVDAYREQLRNAVEKIYGCSFEGIVEEEILEAEDDDETALHCCRFCKWWERCNSTIGVCHKPPPLATKPALSKPKKGDSNEQTKTKKRKKRKRLPNTCKA